MTKNELNVLYINNLYNLPILKINIFFYASPLFV